MVHRINGFRNGRGEHSVLAADFPRARIHLELHVRGQHDLPNRGVGVGLNLSELLLEHLAHHLHLLILGDVEDGHAVGQLQRVALFPRGAEHLCVLER